MSMAKHVVWINNEWVDGWVDEWIGKWLSAGVWMVVWVNKEWVSGWRVNVNCGGGDDG